MKKYFLILVLIVGCASDNDCDCIKTTYSAKNNKVLVCHNGTTLSIDEKALDAHLAHGDVLGECSTLSDNGLDSEYEVITDCDRDGETGYDDNKPYKIECK